MIADDDGQGRPKIVLLGLPFDENSSFLRGAADAPSIIRSALRSGASNFWSEDGTDLGDEALFGDAGDVIAAPGEDGFARIEASVRSVLARNLRPIGLGGDHAVVYPVIRAVASRHPGLTVVDFDAHPDLYDEYSGNRHSHACPFARIMEEGLVRRLVQIGVRTLNGHQRRQAERFGVEIIEMRAWRGVVPELQAPLYLSFDMDALDPAFAPGVSHPEPGGFSVREVLSAIQELRAEVVGADIVEFNPRLDPAGITAFVCAKLVKEIAAKMLESTRYKTRAEFRGRG